MLHPIYYVILILFTLASFGEFFSNIIQKGVFIAMCVIMIFMAGIRVGQGADYWPYFDLFIGANKYVPWNTVFDRVIGIEPTYVFLSKIVGSLHLPFTVLLFLFAAISISLKAKTVYDFSPLPVFTLLYFYMPGLFASDMGHMRQGLATSICLFSFRYIVSRNLFKYLICLYLAYLTHKTAMVFIPAYWIANMKISTTKAFLIVVLGVILWPLKPYLLIGEFLTSVSTDNLAAASYNSYVNSMQDIGFTITEVVKIIFLFIIFTNDKYIIKQGFNDNYMKIRNLVITFYFIYYAFHGNTIFSVRLAAIYQAFEMILFGMILVYSRYRIILYSYFLIYIYLISWRFWENAEALGFNKLNNIFTTPTYILQKFTPTEFADENKRNTYQVK